NLDDQVRRPLDVVLVETRGPPLGDEQQVGDSPPALARQPDHHVGTVHRAEAAPRDESANHRIKPSSKIRMVQVVRRHQHDLPINPLRPGLSIDPLDELGFGHATAGMALKVPERLSVPMSRRFFDGCTKHTATSYLPSRLSRPRSMIANCKSRPVNP